MNEGGELRIRITGESHTALQLFRSRLNANKDVEYANYFVGHPELDEPEFYLRCKKGKNPSKILKGLCKDIASEFEGLSLPCRDFHDGRGYRRGMWFDGICL